MWKSIITNPKKAADSQYCSDLLRKGNTQLHKILRFAFYNMDILVVVLSTRGRNHSKDNSTLLSLKFAVG